MNTGVPKRSIMVKGRKTSVSLEDAFWRDLRVIAQIRQTSVSGLINQVDAVRAPQSNLSSALRVFILDHYRNRCEQQSHSLQEESGSRVPAVAAGQPHMTA
jgi:predicted DNA-binding ribbon-helix-helix protein